MNLVRVAVEKNISIATVKMCKLVSLKDMQRAIYTSMFFVVLISFSITGCFKNQPLDSDIIRYSNMDEIIDPPDEFQLVYTLKTFNNYLAIIEFETDAVWEIERLSAPGFNTLKVERRIGDSNPQLEIIDALRGIDSIGFAGGIQYNFWANRSSGDETYRTFLLQFTKQETDYENFSPRI